MDIDWSCFFIYFFKSLHACDWNCSIAPGFLARMWVIVSPRGGMCRVFEAEIKKTRLKLKITPKKCISHWTVSSRFDGNWLQFKRTGRPFEFSARRQYKDASVRKSLFFLFFFYISIGRFSIWGFVAILRKSEVSAAHTHWDWNAHQHTHTHTHSNRLEATQAPAEPAF